MIFTLVQKEIANNLLSFRFTLSLVVSLILFTAGSVAFVQRYTQDMEEYSRVTNDNLSNLSKVSERGPAAIAHQIQTFRTRPLPAGIICSGHDKIIPNTFTADAFRTYLPEVKTGGNCYLSSLRQIDWVFVITMILSFFAVLLTFDSLSGEKESGTLALSLANPVPRDTLLLGKYLGALITLTIPLLLGMLSSLVVLNLSGIVLSGLEWMESGLFVVASLLFLSIFLLLGMLVSGRAASSSTSIVILLFIWVITILIIPAAGKLAAQKFRSVPARSAVVESYQQALMDIFNDPNKDAKYGKYCGNWNSSNIDAPNVNPPARGRLFNAITASRDRITSDYVIRIIDQAETGRRAGMISPAVILQRLAESLFGTGVAGFRNMYERVLAYRDPLIEFLVDEDMKDPDSRHIFAWNVSNESPLIFSWKPVDVNSIPKFNPREPSLGKKLHGVWLDIVALCGLNLMLFACVFILFLRCDVRQG